MVAFTVATAPNMAWADAASEGDDDLLPARFFCDFRNQKYDYNALTMQGTRQSLGAPSNSLPKDSVRHCLPSVSSYRKLGVTVNYRVHGNFRITASFELLETKRYRGDEWVGPMIWLRLEDPSEATASITMRRQHWRLVYAGSALAPGTQGGQGQSISNERSAKSASGSLRLTRIGPRLYFSVADETQRFHDILDCDFPTENVEFISCSLVASGDEVPAGTAVERRRNPRRTTHQHAGPAPNTAWHSVDEDLSGYRDGRRPGPF